MIELQHFFSAAPGGLMESIAMSEQYGGKIKVVTLQQFLRIIFVIILVPVMISIWFGAPVGSAAGFVLEKNAIISVIDLFYIAILIILVSFWDLSSECLLVTCWGLCF